MLPPLLTYFRMLPFTTTIKLNLDMRYFHSSIYRYGNIAADDLHDAIL